MNSVLTLLNSQGTAFHMRATIDLSNPMREIKASVVEYRYRACIARSLSMMDWNHVMGRRVAEQNDLIWAPLLNRLMSWVAVINATIDKGIASNGAQAVLHGGQLDGTAMMVTVDGRGVPSSKLRTTEPSSLEDMIFSLDPEIVPSTDTIIDTVVIYARERLPREDGFWHYNIS